jgi:hypothetical protein
VDAGAFGEHEQQDVERQQHTDDGGHQAGHSSGGLCEHAHGQRRAQLAGRLAGVVDQRRDTQDQQTHHRGAQHSRYVPTSQPGHQRLGNRRRTGHHDHRNQERTCQQHHEHAQDDGHGHTGEQPVRHTGTAQPLGHIDLTCHDRGPSSD